MAISLFPTLLAIFLSIGMLKSSGVIDFISIILEPITSLIGIPNQIMPLCILRPISGSAAMAVATGIMEKYGVDTLIGMITATVMGSTETTFYTIAVYTSSVKIKKTGFVLIPAICADIVGIVSSVVIWRILS